MDDSGPAPGPRCWWCGAPFGEDVSPRRRYCPRPRLCRDQAYRDSRKAKNAMPARDVLARAGYSLDTHLQNVREVLLQAVLQEDAWPGVFALAAAGIESRAADLVRVCVLEERAAGTSWAAIGEPFGISADAARKRWGHWALAPHEDDDQPHGG
ncbi:hypothetical protein [Streptomyces europaeiscabiei]|uniref:hypothetical protein n=1 Tax=Streptomyces europaeiscabiei TaxID=146819 RepID=UPI0029AF962A|nr:hypothetical protein [Streptomyces europaeiscabiei]MDX3867213.1 hypothetical protein [Streptomyces europaeiscabiei]